MLFIYLVQFFIHTTQDHAVLSSLLFGCLLEPRNVGMCKIFRAWVNILTDIQMFTELKIIHVKTKQREKNIS